MIPINVKGKVEVLKNWVIDTNKDTSTNIKHCGNITEWEVCATVLSYMTASADEFKDPESFYYFAVDVATAVADEYYWRWSTGIGEHENWKDYEYWIPRLTARVIKEMIPELFRYKNDSVWICGIDEGSMLLENIIRRYNVMKNDIDSEHSTEN